MRLDAIEFIRRFLLHVLPKGFKKIRHFGFLSPRYKAKNIALIRQLCSIESQIHLPVEESVEDMMLQLTGIDIKVCPKCGKRHLAGLYELKPEYIDYILSQRKKMAWDTS